MKTAEQYAKEDFDFLGASNTKAYMKASYTPDSINRLKEFMLQVQTLEFTEAYWKEFERLLKE